MAINTVVGLLQAANLLVDEAHLTGESEPVRKTTAAQAEENQKPPLQRLVGYLVTNNPGKVVTAILTTKDRWTRLFDGTVFVVREGRFLGKFTAPNTLL